MFFLLDGYNLLFAIQEKELPFQKGRDTFIVACQKAFQRHHLTGILLFDGRHKRKEESGRLYGSPLEIAYAPEGQSADCYIIEWLSSHKTPNECIVVTNDKGLKKRALQEKATVFSLRQFLQFLEKKEKKDEKKISKESSREFLRLLQAFEKKNL